MVPDPLLVLQSPQAVGCECTPLLLSTALEDKAGSSSLPCSLGQSGKHPARV